MRLVELLAQAATNPSSATGTPTSAPTPSWLPFVQNPLFILLLVMVVFFIFTSKSKSKQENQRKNMLAQLKRGDRVQTIGGVLGTVIEAKDDEVTVKVDENSNTKMRFTRSAIHRVVEADKVESK